MSSKVKIWYSAISQTEYVGNAPTFYDTSQFDWTKNIESNYQLIYEELQAYLKTDQKLQAYFDKTLVTKSNSWKTISLMAWGVKFHKEMKQFPQTMKILNSIPELVSVSFNLLDPNSEIKSHFGDTNAIARCHLGLDVPGTLPEIGFRVKNEKRSWEEGKLLMFCDGYIHSAFNNTDKPRFILLFDIVLPEFQMKKNSICASVLSSLFIQSTLSKLRIHKKPTKWILFPLLSISKYAAWAIKPMYNVVNKTLN